MAPTGAGGAQTPESGEVVQPLSTPRALVDVHSPHGDGLAPGARRDVALDPRHAGTPAGRASRLCPHDFHGMLLFDDTST
jgi:hypothetical protein